MYLPLGKSPEQHQNKLGSAKARVLFALLGLAFAAGVFTPSHGARAAIGFVQQASNAAVNGSTAVSATFTNATARGNFIAVVVTSNLTAPTIGISDNKGNTYSKAASLSDGTVKEEIWYASNVSGGVTHAVTAALTGGSAMITLAIHEYSGIAVSSPLDVTSTHQDGTCSYTSGSTTTNFTTELLIGGHNSNTNSGVSFTPDAGWTKRILQNNPSGMTLETQDQVVAAGTYQSSGTVDQCGGLYSVMATFKEGRGVQVSSRSDTLSDSRPSATSNHTIAFTTNTAVYGSSISGSSTLTIGFPSAFAIPVGMDCGDVDVATGSQFNFNYPSCYQTATAWGFSATGYLVTLIPPTDTAVHVSTGTPITIKIGSNATVGQQGGHWITNPSTGGVYTISVGGTFGGSGNMLVSIKSGVSVQATVAESLSFTVNPVAQSLFVQAAHSGFPTAPSVSAVFGGNVASGDVIAFAGNTFAAVVPTSVTSSCVTGNLTIDHTATSSNGGGMSMFQGYGIISSAGPCTVTANWPSSIASQIFMEEIAGINTSNPTDTSTLMFNNAGPTAVNSGSVTTTKSTDYVFGALYDGSGNGVTWSNISPGFVAKRDQAGGFGTAIVDGVQTVTGAISLTATDGGTTGAAGLIAFQAASNCTADDGATVNQIGTTAASVPFGIISPNTFYQGCQDLIVSTNAGNGYSVTVQESSAMRTVDGRFSIPDTTCDAGDCTVATATTWVTPTKNGFGHTCFNQSGSDCNPTYGSGKKFKPVPNIPTGTSPGQISFVQQNAGICTVSCTSTTIPFTANNTAGNLIVVAFDYPDTVGLTSVTDTQGNVYVRAGLENHLGAPPNQFDDIYYASNIKGGANSVTVKLNGSSGGPEVYINEYSGLDPNSPLDVTASSTGNSASMDSGPGTTNFANELIFGWGPNNNAPVITGPGFTARSNFNGNIIEDKVVSTIGTYDAVATLNGVGNWSMQMATFRASNTPVSLMSSTSTVTNSTGRVKYRLSAGTAQPAGKYTTIISYTIYAAY